MMRRARQSGFTIVELLIVVVVIAILATITIVAYSGIRERAQTSSLQSSLSQAVKQVQTAAVTNQGVYPATLAEAGVVDSKDVTYQYTIEGDSACVTATYAREKSFYLCGDGGVQREGIAPGHNIVVWYKSVAGAPAPITAGSVDTSVFRSGDRSMRLGTSTTGVGIRGSSFEVTQGQVYTVGLWIRTDPNWNGASNNSKIRYGDPVANSLLTACGYQGVKTAWTYVSCSYTVPSGVTHLSISVGNDGSVGNIWIDDLSVTVK